MTKFPEDSDFKEKVRALRKSIENTTTKNNDASFILFLGELPSKLDEDDFKFIDLIGGDRKKNIKFLEKANPIHRPDEAFKFSISSSSQAVIKEQLRKHQLVISSCIKEKDFAFVDFKLKEIKYLNDLLKEESIKQIYEECLKTITKSVNLQYKES